MNGFADARETILNGLSGWHRTIVDTFGTIFASLAGLCGRRALIQPKALDDSWLIVPNLWEAIIAGPGMMEVVFVTNRFRYRVFSAGQRS
jgi:hypothetical protein